MAVKKKAASYGELQAQLDDVLIRLEDPTIDIDEATAAYEAGLLLIKQLQDHLAGAENRISKAQADFTAEAGN